MTSYQVLPESAWDVFRAPVELPGETAARDYLIVKPSNQVIGSAFTQQSLFELQLANPSQYIMLDDSFLAFQLQLTSAAGNPAALTATADTQGVAIMFNPSWFRQLQLTIGSTVIESTSAQAGITQYVDNMLRWSKSAQLGEGDLEWITYLDPVLQPVAGASVGVGSSAYPPALPVEAVQAVPVASIPATYAGALANYITQAVAGTLFSQAGAGTQSIDIRPVITSLTASDGGGGTFAAAQASSFPNPAYNYSYYWRIQPFAGQYANGKCNLPFSVRLPLNRLFGFCRDGMPVLFSQPINIRLYPNNAGQLIQKQSTTLAYDFIINSFDLFLRVLKPSAAVAARLLTQAAEGASTRYQFNAHDTFSYSSGGLTNQFTVTLGLPSYNIQFLVLTFRPNTYTNQMVVGSKTNQVQCSLCPSPIFGNNVPFSQAYVTYGQQLIPTVPYGSTKSDLVRMYNAYLEVAGAMDISAEGPLLSYEAWSQNHFLLCFDLRNREATAVAGGAPATSLTINLNFAVAPTAGTDANGTATTSYIVQATWYACKEVELKASSAGVQVLNV